MYRPRNEQCPQRGVGLTHTVNHGPQCVHCGAVTMVISPVNVQELREKAIQDSKPTTKQDRWWDFLRWWYRTPRGAEDRLLSVSPSDEAWIRQALAKLDELD